MVMGGMTMQPHPAYNLYAYHDGSMYSGGKMHAGGMMNLVRIVHAGGINIQGRVMNMHGGMMNLGWGEYAQWDVGDATFTSNKC